jgi:SH3 domain-containing YSC84-like protein 1
MKPIIIVLALTPAFLLADTRSQDLNRISEATNILHEVMSTPGKSIPESIIGRAQCVGIIPRVKKAGFVLAGKYGVGIITCRTRSGWSAPSTITIEGGSIGFQIGAGESNIFLVVQNQSGEQALMADKFTLNAGAGAMAGPVGRSVGAETSPWMQAKILTYARSRGLFAGVDLGGATLRPDHNANRKIYGRPVTQRQILSGEVRPPAAARSLYGELNHYALTARR